MNEIFQVVYKFLKWISQITGFTYHEINIIVYFIVIPALFIFLLSRIFKQKMLIIGFLILVFFAVIIIPDFSEFSTQLFDKSVVFLNWFDHLGLNYIQASVVICVIIPVLILILLRYFYRKFG